MNYSSAVTTLQKYRKTGERISKQVVDAGKVLLGSKGNISRLGDEVWAVYEQVGIAAMDTGDEALVDTCLEALEKKFPKSPRLMSFQGMRLESSGRYEAALELYKDILAEDETNVMISKRHIACLRDMGRTQDAIDMLNRYLDAYYADVEAWLELSDLYLELAMYSQAAFCIEELLLQAPLQHIYHLKYAEIQYTVGNVGLALKEFCRALELCPDHVRSLYGIKQSTTILLDSRQTGNISFTKERLQQLNQLATEQLLHVYAKASTKDTETLRTWLGQ